MIQSTWDFRKSKDSMGFSGGPVGKNSNSQCRRHKRHGFTPWVGRSPGVGNGNPLHYSCLENSMERWTWQAIVHGVSKCQTWQSNWARAHTHTHTHTHSHTHTHTHTHSWRQKTDQRSPGATEGKGWTGRVHRIFRTVKLLDILLWWMDGCHCAFVLIECTTPRVSEP